MENYSKVILAIYKLHLQKKSQFFFHTILQKISMKSKIQQMKYRSIWSNEF